MLWFTTEPYLQLSQAGAVDRLRCLTTTMSPRDNPHILDILTSFFMALSCFHCFCFRFMTTEITKVKLHRNCLILETINTVAVGSIILHYYKNGWHILPCMSTDPSLADTRGCILLFTNIQFPVCSYWCNSTDLAYYKNRTCVVGVIENCKCCTLYYLADNYNLKVRIYITCISVFVFFAWLSFGGWNMDTHSIEKLMWA